MDDAIGLADALNKNRPLSDALSDFQANRKPVVEKIVRAADASGDWYESFAGRMDQTPLEFGYDYITRSGRISDQRLAQFAPDFAANYQTEKSTQR